MKKGIKQIHSTEISHLVYCIDILHHYIDCIVVKYLIHYTFIQTLIDTLIMVFRHATTRL